VSETETNNPSEVAPQADDPWRYELLRDLIRDERLPAMIVDLDVLEANVARLAAVAKSAGKTLRMASKSVRVPDLITRILDTGGSALSGVMCFCVEEAAFLARNYSLDDLLVAYPSMQKADLAQMVELTREGRRVSLMIDSEEHIDILAAFARSNSGGDTGAIRVALDLDMSWRPPGMHVGVKRSPLRTVHEVEVLVDRLLKVPELRLAGVMGYEAQIAGLGDASPFSPLTNAAKRLIKGLSVNDVRARREEVALMLQRKGVELEFFNGGGTGSIDTTCKEPWITEATAGSGFLQSHLFDYYVSNRNQAAFAFALQVTRFPEKGMLTCQSGGFIASGEPGADKAPVVFRPSGLTPRPIEGFGEVQTPLQMEAHLEGQLALGDPVFFRPAKAGEVAERFNEYILKRGDQIVGRAQTYRGLGQTFF
jgi:D-serine deaminase-like pyridoxal phosphate-dependent protein